MTIKVIGAGFGRTGTLSLKIALEKLGFDKAHHMMEVGKSATQREFWSKIGQGVSPNWDDVFHGFQSTTDFPACIYYEELSQHYPDAKVVLTVRDEDTWYRSVFETIWQFGQAVPVWLRWLVPPVRRMIEMVNSIVWQGVFDNRAGDAEHAKAVFRAHNQEVVARIPADRLLVFQVKEGWEPLCEFLGVEIPAEPFPHVNDTAEMKRRIRILRAIAYLPLVIVAGLLYVTLA